MRVQRVVPLLTVDDLPRAVHAYRALTGLEVVMDHGWIVTLADSDGAHQLSLMTADATAPVEPTVSIFVDDVHEALSNVEAAGMEIVHPLTDEPWGVTRFFVQDDAGNVLNVGMHTDALEVRLRDPER